MGLDRGGGEEGARATYTEGDGSNQRYKNSTCEAGVVGYSVDACQDILVELR